MRLRLRSSESKETLKIEAPNSCTLSQLKEILSQNLPNSPSPASIRLSLNRKDELQSDGEDSLHSLGIAAGDLIFYSLQQPAPGTSSNRANTLYPAPDSVSKPDTMISEPSMVVSPHNTLPQSQKSDMEVVDSQKRKSPDAYSHMETGTAVADMEVDADNDNPDGLSAEILDKSLSVPGFLRKVFTEELGDDSGRDHKLIVIAVHAVMLESGFVGFDQSTNAIVNGFQLGEEWPSGLFRLSLFYTLPDVLNVNDASGDKIKSVVLKFQNLGKFMNVYGSLSGGSGNTNTHWLRLNEDQLVPFLNVVWANCGVRETLMEQDDSFLGTPEKEVFQFWRNVKDNLALPLLIDMCEKAGLALPPCFMRLPTDLKMKILESLPGVDVGKVSCVCSELRYLASNDDLWKFKFLEEYGNERKEGQWSWKIAFAKVWENRKSRKLASRVERAPYNWPMPWGSRYRSPPFVPQVPGIIGGEHDIWPHLGNDIHNRLHHRANHLMRNFSPRCNLGGHESRRFI